MRLSERSWLAAPGLWAAGAPRIAGLLLLGLMLAAMAVAPQLRFDPDIYRSFSTGNPHLAAYADFLQRAGPKPRHIVVLAEADEPMPLDAFEHIRDISLDISLLDGVGAVVSIGTARFPEDAAVHAGQPLLPLDMHAKAFPERLRAFEKSKPLSSILLTGDRKAAVVHVVVEDDAPPALPSRSLVRFPDCSTPPRLPVSASRSRARTSSGRRSCAPSRTISSSTRWRAASSPWSLPAGCFAMPG